MKPPLGHGIFGTGARGGGRSGGIANLAGLWLTSCNPRVGLACLGAASSVRTRTGVSVVGG